MNLQSTSCDARNPDPQVMESDEDDTPYELTQEDLAEVSRGELPGCMPRVPDV